MRLAIIIPTLDEEAALRAHLGVALHQGDEVIVSDGGSTDASCDVAASLGAGVVGGRAGRAAQMNRGAGAAGDADVLLFLHADTLLPAGARAAIESALERGAEGGGFRVRFASTSRLLRFGGRLVNLRTRLLRLPLGDQAQFVRRDVFTALGGFRDWPLLEDLDLARRLRRRGKSVVLRAAVTTSARRFERRGIARTVATNWLIWGLFALGVRPERLARLYLHVR